MCCLVLNVLKTIAVHLLPQVIDYLNKALVTGCHIYKLMKCHIGLSYLDKVITLRISRKSFIGLLQIIKLLLIHIPDCKLNRKLLKRCAYLQHIP